MFLTFSVLADSPRKNYFTRWSAEHKEEDTGTFDKILLADDIFSVIVSRERIRNDNSVVP